MRLLLILVLFASCAGPEKLYNKAKAKDPVKVAELCSQDWPCITIERDTAVITDTIIDIISLDCPDTAAYGPDSVIIRVPVKVNVPMPRIRETREITIRIRDSVTVYLAAKANKRTDDMEGKVKRRNKVILWLIVALVISILLNILKLRR